MLCCKKAKTNGKDRQSVSCYNYLTFLRNLFQTETAVKIWLHYLLSSQISLTYVMVKDSYLMSAMQERTVLETVVPSIATNAKR